MPSEDQRWDRVNNPPQGLGFKAASSTHDRPKEAGADEWRHEVQKERLYIRWIFITAVLVALVALVAWQVLKPQ